ncbi:hypothetical protein RZN25_11435 [Bacillaceae bacterium S4-13-56]
MEEVWVNFFTEDKGRFIREKVLKINEDYIGYIDNGDFWMDTITHRKEGELYIKIADKNFKTIRVGLDSFKNINFHDQPVKDFLLYVISKSE